ncbi:MAG: hypothetical protein AAF927_22015 [Bacteroidota bacterium]
MKKSFILLLFLGVSAAFAQQKVEYRVIESHAKLPYVQVGLIATGLDVSVPFQNIDAFQLNAGLGLDAKMHIGNLLHVQAYGYRANFIDMQRWFGLDEGILGAENKNEADPGRGFEFDLGASFTPFIKKTNGKGATRVPLKTVSDRRVGSRRWTETTTYIDIPGEHVTFKGFRGGINRYRYNLAGNLLTASGESFRDHYGSITATALYGGVSWSSYSYAKINAVGYGEKKGGMLFSLYADVFFGPTAAMTMISNQQEYEIVSADGVAIGNNPLGFRLGFERYTAGRFGIGYRLEGGVRPGFAKSPYLRMDLIMPVYSMGKPSKKD